MSSSPSSSHPSTSVLNDPIIPSVPPSSAAAPKPPSPFRLFLSKTDITIHHIN
ncbi:MAG: hypothetical protein Q9216_005938, partial [Gyalolechia sp. 2 TL-2023]